MIPRLLRPLALALLAALPLGALAQDLFSPVIVVNDRAVTGFELDQRTRLLTAFGTPGDIGREARKQLVEDRLKQQEMDRAGVTLTPESLAQALSDFAGRASLTLDQFEAQLAGQGVEPETLRDYVRINVTWRDYVRARFGDRVTVTEPEIDQRIARMATESQGLEVLLSEIIIPAPPPQAAQAQALAERLSKITSTAEFEAQARRASAVPSRERGGNLDWVPISNYPQGLQDLLLTLTPGQVTPPLQLQGAVALLQLRDLREGQVSAAQPTSLDYAVLRIPGGLSPEGLAEAARVAARVDTCSDLFTVARGLPPEQLIRATVAPGDLPEDLALDLAKLDPNEATWGRTEDEGRTLLFTMLCARTYALPDGAASRDTVAEAIRGDLLITYADALVADLRAAATIVGE